MTNEEIVAALEKPFKVKDLQFRVGSRNGKKTSCIPLAYIDTRAVMDRLNEVFGMFNWYSINTELSKGGLLTTLWVRIGDEWFTKQDGSDYTDIESIKGGISGGLKRAAAQFGIGKYLYDIPTVWVELKDEKYFADSHMDLCNRVLPDWAILPEELAMVRKKTVPAKTNAEPPKEESKIEIPTTIESAKVLRCESGYSKGKLFKDLTEVQLKWLLNNGNAAEKAAAKLCLDYSEN